MEHAKGSFSFVELDASFAPWLCTAAVLATRLGLDFQATAVERAKFLFDMILRHFAENGIDCNTANVQLINAAVATSRYLPLYFPKVASAGNLGSAVSFQNDGEREPIAACELCDVVPENGCDLLYVSIKGTEAELFEINRQLLDGLNAFYVRDEDAWRDELIARPPSVWDCVTPYRAPMSTSEPAPSDINWLAQFEAFGLSSTDQAWLLPKLPFGTFRGKLCYKEAVISIVTLVKNASAASSHVTRR